MQSVKAWKEKVVIPTYEVGKPEKNPIFLEKRVYQGSSGSVYPHPVIEKISDEKTDKEYVGLFLENDYIKVMILPEIGGRIQMAYDKIKERHFVYYNQVIKPALVGLTGPWISGGIEFNWPQHHRPSTFDPIDYTIENHSDGSCTVWVSEIEKMFRTKGMAGFRLYPDKAYIEINAKLFNRTPFPQTFLWWANPAVKVNDDYQSVFPPDVNAVFDHGKRDVSEFPIAKGTYYKVDYSPGTDISRYKNIPVPTSYMAIKSEYDFMGGYEHDSKGGLLHVANHHVSPGKKQWTWGCGEFGQAWDRQLTDENGPYIELMTGVFTDNQPDFSWIHPNEVRTFTQYFMPYSELGLVKNATKEAMVNLELISDNQITIKLYTTGKYDNCQVILKHLDDVLLDQKLDIDPSRPHQTELKVKKGIVEKNLDIRLYSSSGRELVGYQPGKKQELEIPEAAKPALAPENISSIEELFLTGLHIEQYRHATFDPTDYYQEAIKREPTDVRANNAMGLWYLRRGQFKKAKPYFEQAIQTLTKRNPNPYDGEPYHNLGICEKLIGNSSAAYDAFYKSTWNAGWQDSSYLEIARIDVSKGNLDLAFDHINKSLNKNFSSGTARHLKVVILGLLGKRSEAITLAKESLEIDLFNLGCYVELYKLTSETYYLEEFKKFARGNFETYAEYAWDYAQAGLFEEATNIITLYTSSDAHFPLAYYYQGYFAHKSGQDAKAKEFYKKGSTQKPDYCFPNRIEDVVVLENSILLNPADSKAPYYLGVYLYAKKDYDQATQLWEKSIKLDHSFATPHRNLSLAYFNKQRNYSKALESLEKAFNLNPKDARILMELDQLYKILNKPLEFRLTFLETHLELVEQRDDLYLERASIYNSLGKHGIARELMLKRQFHPWEGGEGKVVSQYVSSHTEAGKDLIERGEYANALQLLEAAEFYPHNLGEGKLFGAQENDIHYWKGVAWEGLGDKEKAQEFYQMATVGLNEPAIAFYYNDQQPDKIVYQGLAWNKLGDTTRANDIFQRVLQFGQKHLNDTIKIDYFAVSMPDLLVFEQDLSIINKIHCHYMIGLGFLGLGDFNQAETHFTKVLSFNSSHQGAQYHKRLLNKTVWRTLQNTYSTKEK